MVLFIYFSLDKKTIDLGSETQAPSLAPQKLEFALNGKLIKSLEQAEVDFDALAGKHDLRVVNFEGYGKNLIKKFGVSPDAFAQMAIQLAYFKLYGVSRATYESSGTRKYKYGRTETGRSVSIESVAWVKAMQNPHVSVCVLRYLFRLKKRESLVDRQLLPNLHIWLQLVTATVSIVIS